MRFLTVAATLAFATAAVGVSELTRVRRDDSMNSTCLSHDDAQSILDKFIMVMEHQDVNAANETVHELLADSYSEASDSINTLSARPLGSITFPNKMAYIADIINAPAPRNITTLKLMVAECTNILWFWKMQIGAQVAPVQGFSLMEIDENHKILSQHLEFNSIAWGIDTGFTVINRMGVKLGPTNSSAPAHASAASSSSSQSTIAVLVVGLLGIWLACL